MTLLPLCLVALGANLIELQISCDSVAASSSSLGSSKDPATDPVEDKNDSDDDSSKLENSDFVSLLCHSRQSSGTTLQAIREV